MTARPVHYLPHAGPKLWVFDGCDGVDAKPLPVIGWAVFELDDGLGPLLVPLAPDASYDVEDLNYLVFAHHPHPIVDIHDEPIESALADARRSFNRRLTDRPPPPESSYGWAFAGERRWPSFLKHAFVPNQIPGGLGCALCATGEGAHLMWSDGFLARPRARIDELAAEGDA